MGLDRWFRPFSSKLHSTWKLGFHVDRGEGGSSGHRDLGPGTASVSASHLNDRIDGVKNGVKNSGRWTIWVSAYM